MKALQESAVKLGETLGETLGEDVGETHGETLGEDVGKSDQGSAPQSGCRLPQVNVALRSPSLP